MKNKVFLIGAFSVFALNFSYINTINTFINHEISISNKGYSQDLLKTYHLGKDDINYYTTGYTGNDNFFGDYIGDLFFKLPEKYFEVEIISITGIEVRDDIHQTTRWIETSFDKDDIDINIEEDGTTLVVEDVRSYGKGWTFGFIPGWPVHYGVPPRLTEDFDIEIKAKDGEPDTYSISDDNFTEYTEIIEKNFYNLNKKSYNRVPFFTNNDTYSDLEEVIKNNNIIESKNSIPIDYIDFTFYDEYQNEINKNSKINSSQIRTKLTSEDPMIEGESDILSYNIPYLNINIKEENEENIFDFREEDEVGDSDPTDNNTSEFNWTFKNNIWNFKTNVPLIFEINGEFIESISSGTDKIVFSVNEKTTITSEQINKSGSNSFDKTITIVNREGYEWKFKYDFQADSKNNNNIQVESLNDWNIVSKDKIMETDINGNGVVDSNEIFVVNIVNNDFLVEVDKTDNLSLFELKNENWVHTSNYYDNSELIITPGVYGFKTINEYGNVNFEVVEYLDENSESIFTNFDETNLYSKNRLIAESIGINKNSYDSFTPHEQRYLNDYIIETGLLTPNKRKFRGLMITSISLTTIIIVGFSILLLSLIYKNKKKNKITNKNHENHLNNDDLMEYLDFNNE